MKNELIKVLEQVDDLLKGIRYWVSGGIVLGFIREGDFLKNEHDIDLGIDEKDLDKVIKVLKKRYGDKVQVSLEAVDSNVVLRPIDGTDIIRVIKFYIDDTSIDIFVHYGKGNKYYFVTKDDEVGYAYHAFPKKLFRNFKKLQIYGRKYNIPNPPEDYLKCEYGDWKVPRSDWNHAVDPPCIERNIKLRSNK